MDWWGADVYFEVAWGDAPLTPDASCTWVDETAYVRRVATNRGRQSELSSVSPGTLSAALDNSTRRFDPTNTAGAHYGELLPMTKVRFRAGAASAVTVFSGFVLGWPITYPGMTDSVVTVQCVDAMRVLEQSETPGSAYAAAVLADSPSNYWPLQQMDDAGVSPAVVGDVDALTPSGFGAPVDLGFPVGQADGLSSSATALSRGDVDVSAATIPATIEAWVGAGAYSNPPGPASIGVVVSDTDAFYINLFETDFRVVYSHGGSRDTAGAGGVAFTYPTPTTSTPAHVTATVSGGTIYAYVNGALVGSSALTAGSYSNGLGITNGLFVRLSAKPLGHVAFYGSALSATQVRTHYEAGTIAHGHPMGERTGERIARILDTIGVETTATIYTPGTSGNYVSAPDAAALDITGDMTVMAWVLPDDTTPAANSTMIAKSSSTAGQRSWRLVLTSTGLVRLSVSSDGSTVANRPSTVAPTWPSTGGMWIACTLDADNGAAGHSVRYWQAYGSPTTTPTSWTQIGSTVTTAGTVTLFSSTSPVTVGLYGTATEPFAGTFGRVLVASGIGGSGVPGGSTVLDINPNTDCPTAGVSSFTATSGQTITVATSGTPATTITPAQLAAGHSKALQPGSTVCGQWEPDGANALSQIRALEDLEQGLFFIAGDGAATFRDRNWLTVNTRAVTPRVTFGDSGSEAPYGDIEIDGNHLEHIRNTVTVSYPGAAITVKDATSRAAYGIQADSVDASQLPTWGGWLARQLASFRLRTRKDPATRIPTLQVDPRASSNFETTLDALVGLELGDRVRVIRRPSGSTDPIQKDCHVQGIAHTVTPANWSTTLYLSPAPQSYSEAGNLLVGDATYGIVGAGYESRY